MGRRVAEVGRKRSERQQPRAIRCKPKRMADDRHPRSDGQSDETKGEEENEVQTSVGIVPSAVGRRGNASLARSPSSQPSSHPSPSRSCAPAPSRFAGAWMSISRDCQPARRGAADAEGRAELPSERRRSCSLARSGRPGREAQRTRAGETQREGTDLWLATGCAHSARLLEPLAVGTCWAGLL